MNHHFAESRKPSTNCLSAKHKSVSQAKLEGVESLFNEHTQKESKAVAMATASSCHPCPPPAKLLLAILDKRYIISTVFYISFKRV